MFMQPTLFAVLDRVDSTNNTLYWIHVIYLINKGIINYERHY